MASRQEIEDLLASIVQVVGPFVKAGAKRADLAPVFTMKAEVEGLFQNPAASQSDIDAVYASMGQTVRYLKHTLRPKLTQRAAVAAGTPAPGEAGSPETAAQAQGANDFQAAASVVVSTADALNEAEESQEAAEKLGRRVAEIVERVTKLLDLHRVETYPPYTKGLDLYRQRQNYRGAYQSWRIALDKLAELLSAEARKQKLGLLAIPMPADLIGTPSSALPAGVKAPPEEGAEPTPSLPVGAPSVQPEVDLPPAVAAAPTETVLIDYIKGSAFNVTEAMRMVRELWPDFSDMGAFRCAVASALRQFPADHPDIYVFRWTTAPPVADLRGPKAKDQTIEVGNASPGPEGMVWRRVAIPAERTGEQINAYKAVGGRALDDGSYEVVLRESMQPGPSEIPIMKGTTSPAEVDYERFYVEEDGKVLISNAVYRRLVEDPQIETDLDPETFENVFVGSWGRVSTQAEGTGYRLFGEPAALANFLILLDGMAKSLGAVSPSEAAIEVAEAEEEEEDDDWFSAADEEEEDEETVVLPPVVRLPPSPPISTVKVIEAQVVPAKDAYIEFVRQILRLGPDDNFGFTTPFVPVPEEYTFKISAFTQERGKITVKTKRLNGEALYDVFYDDNVGYRYRSSGQLPSADFGTPANILGDLRTQIDNGDMFLDEVKVGAIIGGAAEGRAAQNEGLLLEALEKYVVERLKEQLAPSHWLELE